MQTINNVDSEASKHASAIANAASAITGGVIIKDPVSNITAKYKCIEAFEKSKTERENYKKLMKEDSEHILTASEKYNELDENISAGVETDG